MTNLTEQWEKGELPNGYYYCKLIINNMKPSIERCKAHCIPMGVSADRGEEVLAEVPSYEEWQASEKYNKHLEEVIKIYERKDKQATETSIAYNELVKENTKLKENIHSMLFTDDVVQDRYDKCKAENAQLKELLKECRKHLKYVVICPQNKKIAEKLDQVLGEE